MLGKITTWWRLRRDGYIVLRQFLDPEEASALRGLVLSVYQLMPDCRSPEHLADHFRRWDGVWLEELPAFLKARDTALLARHEEIGDQIARRAQAYFGASWQPYWLRSFFRRSTGGPNLLPWHIDADAAQIGRPQSFNIWLPLDAVGDSLPSLEVVPRSHRAMRRAPLLPAAPYDRDDSIAATFGGAAAPRLSPGDALVFNQFMLHRTQRPKAGGYTRLSCEFRFFRWNWPVRLRVALRSHAMGRLLLRGARRGFGRRIGI
jgi:hypothetical protein